MYSKQRQQFQIENVPWKRNEVPLKNKQSKQENKYSGKADNTKKHRILKIK